MSDSIVIVDAYETIAQTFEAIFRNAGYDAHAFTSLRQAIGYAREHTPGVALVDVSDNDGVDGGSAGLLMANAAPGCAVILTSDDPSDVELVRSGAQAGYAFEFMAKPFLPQALLAEVKTIVAIRNTLAARAA